VTPWRQPGPVIHFVAIGRQQEWPRMARPPQNYKGAHDFNALQTFITMGMNNHVPCMNFDE
jgi:hypothetical protein